MNCKDFRCEKLAKVFVVYAWRGALNYPSVYGLCEVCADHICWHLERGDWSGGAQPGYLFVIDDDETAPLHCRRNIHSDQ